MPEMRKVANYDRLKTIGQGTYGVVYKARDKKTNEWVALKRIFPDEDGEGISATTIREIAILKQLKHPNIVELRGTFFDSDDIYLVFEFLNGDLKQYLNKYCGDKLLKMDKIKNILYQILSGVAYCHSSQILHRDIKPQNILINYKTDHVKITDFGLSRCYILPNRTWTHEIITLWYRPPEILLGCSKYSIYVDIWSIGCVFVEMLNNNKPLFRGNSEISQLMNIFMKLGTPNITDWPSVYKDCKFFKYPSKYPQWERKPIQSLCSREDLKANGGLDLLNRMFILNPSKRITPKQACKHPFFEKT